MTSKCMDIKCTHCGSNDFGYYRENGKIVAKICNICGTKLKIMKRIKSHATIKK